MKKGGWIIRMILVEGLMVIAVLLVLLMVINSCEQNVTHGYSAIGYTAAIPELPRLSADSLLNSGDAEELDMLPGIGEVISLRIIETRERDGLFIFPEDIMTVKGIGEKRYQDIMDYLAQPEASATDLAP